RHSCRRRRGPSALPSPACSPPATASSVPSAPSSCWSAAAASMSAPPISTAAARSATTICGGWQRSCRGPPAFRSPDEDCPSPRRFLLLRRKIELDLGARGVVEEQLPDLGVDLAAQIVLDAAALQLRERAR